MILWGTHTAHLSILNFFLIRFVLKWVLQRDGVWFLGFGETVEDTIFRERKREPQRLAVMAFGYLKGQWVVCFSTVNNQDVVHDVVHEQHHDVVHECDLLMMLFMKSFCLNLEGFKLITLNWHTIYLILILELYTLISKIIINTTIISLTMTNIKAKLVMLQ